MAERQSIHGEWSSRWAFILAATGAAVGLGNIWKFPYIAGENGGGAFVLFYIACVAFIGVPILMAEILLGRRGRQNPASSVATVAEESGRSRHWGWVGGMGIIASFIVVSYYCVIAGWAVDYIVVSATGSFHGASTQHIDTIFTHLTASPLQMIFWQSVVLISTMYVVGLGVQKGLEKAVILLFPAMLILLFVLVGYSMQSGYFEHALHFLFKPNFDKLTDHAMLVSLGHAFFTLSLATGSIMMYGAYLPKKASITQAAIVIAFADTFVALLSGLAIFPIVFANNLTPGAGPGLIFKTLPIAFGHMPYGTLFATLFFIMLVFAAFTSAISLLEPSVAWLIEKAKISRVRATVFAGIGAWILGLGTVFSFNIWSNFKVFGLNFFDQQDYLSANLLLPLGGLLIAVFVAWRMNKSAVTDELALSNGLFYKIWRLVLGYFCTIAIAFVFLNFMGIL